MLQIELSVVLWLVVWAYIGSTLGFFTIRFNPTLTSKQRMYEYLKSVGVGVFFSLPLYFILQECNGLSHNLSITLAGSSSFAITDFIIKLWPRAIDGVGNAISKLLDRLIGNIGDGGRNDHHDRQDM